MRGFEDFRWLNSAAISGAAVSDGSGDEPGAASAATAIGTSCSEAAL
jgi:hypothetical protein